MQDPDGWMLLTGLLWEGGAWAGGPAWHSPYWGLSGPSECPGTPMGAPFQGCSTPRAAGPCLGAVLLSCCGHPHPAWLGLSFPIPAVPCTHLPSGDPAVAVPLPAPPPPPGPLRGALPGWHRSLPAAEGPVPGVGAGRAALTSPLRNLLGRAGRVVQPATATGCRPPRPGPPRRTALSPRRASPAAGPRSTPGSGPLSPSPPQHRAHRWRGGDGGWRRDRGCRRAPGAASRCGGTSPEWAAPERPRQEGR